MNRHSWLEFLWATTVMCPHSRVENRADFARFALDALLAAEIPVKLPKESGAVDCSCTNEEGSQPHQCSRAGSRCSLEQVVGGSYLLTQHRRQRVYTQPLVSEPCLLLSHHGNAAQDSFANSRLGLSPPSCPVSRIYYQHILSFYLHTYI